MILDTFSRKVWLDFRHRKTEICGESPVRENANLFNFQHRGFATEQTLSGSEQNPTV